MPSRLDHPTPAKLSCCENKGTQFIRSRFFIDLDLLQNKFTDNVRNYRLKHLQIYALKGQVAERDRTNIRFL